MSSWIWMRALTPVCITITLTLFLSHTTPSSISLLPIQLALNVLSSLICLVYGAVVGGGAGGDCCVGEAEQGWQVQVLLLWY